MSGSTPDGAGTPAELPAMAVWDRRALTEDDVARFDLVAPSTVRRARLMVVPVLAPGAQGMTLGRWILLRPGHQQRAALIAHELVHVEQWRDLRAGRFLRRYLQAYAESRGRGLVHRAAYLAIPAEQEARDRTEAWLERGR
jgi:hypothetical protein